MKVYRLSGTVVSADDAVFMDMLDIDYISAKQVYNILKEANGEDIIFNLNSGGGSVLAGSEIYTMLSSYSGHITINITGLSASIASVFMLGADEVNISHQAQIMIHQPRIVVGGAMDALEVQRVKGMLDSTEKSLASVYVKKTKLSEDKILEMMFNETWLTAEEAKELGFVDNIISHGTDTSVVDDLVAMVHTADNQLNVLKELRNMKGSNMEKTFIEKIRSLINGTTSEVEDTVVDNDETVEKTTQEEETVEEQVQEEQVVADDTAIVDLLEKAVNEIEALRAENTELKDKVKTLEDTTNKLSSDNEQLIAKDSKSKEVVAKLNALLDGEEAKVVTVTQKTKTTNEFPVGYKGIRGGNN